MVRNTSTGERIVETRNGVAAHGLRLLPPANHRIEDAITESEIDAALVQRLCDGDAAPAAFADLYDRHAAQVHGIIRAILHDEQLAEEATHDVFLMLWQRPNAYDPERGAFTAWLLRSARNRAIDLHRRRRREQPDAPAPRADAQFALPSAGWLVDPAPDPADQAIARVVGAQVRTALTRLSADHRRLLELAYFGGLTQREIAADLNRPLGTVKTQIRTAMQRLAHLLDDFAPDQRTVSGGQPR